MPDRIQSYKVICGGGLNSNENHLDLSENTPGVATRLVNYEVSLFGGYRRIEGFEPLNTNSSHEEVDPANTEGRILSVSVIKDSTGATRVIATRKVKKFVFTATGGQLDYTGTDINNRSLSITEAASTDVEVTRTRDGVTTALSSSQFSVDHPNNTVSLIGLVLEDDIITIDTNQYKFYKYVPFGAWSPYNTGETHKYKQGLRQVKKVRFASFNFGDGNKTCFVDGVNAPLIYDGGGLPTAWQFLTPAGAGTSTDGGGVNLTGLEQPELVQAFKQHLFFAGDRGSLGIVAHSKPNDPYAYTAQDGSAQLGIGFDVVQIKPFRDSLFIFGSNAIKRASPNGDSNVDASFVVDQITTNVGCVAPDSVLELGGDLVFLAPDGLRPVAGTSRIGDVELETISKSIQQRLSTLSAEFDLNTLNGVVIRGKSQLRYFVGDDTTFTQDSFGLIGGLRSADQRLGWEFGELLGIRASCCTSEYVGTEEIVLHGDYNGKVYRQEQGNQFDGADILAVYATPFFDYGDTEVKKTMRKSKTFIRAEGPFNMDLAATYDWDDLDVAAPSSYFASSTGAPVKYNTVGIEYQQDNGLPSNINYGGSSKPIISTSLQGSGYACQLTYVTFGNFAPYSIQGIIFEFSIAGRR
jgi:hypothetical protein